MDKRLTNKIMVTKPLIPPIIELLPYLSKIWDSGNITNGGQFVKLLEYEVGNYLGVRYLSLFSNGMLALTLALKALKLKGKVITSPFTHIATTQAIYWNNLKPIFVDINESSLNIDTYQIEKSIGPDTCAILPVHIFGNPCEIEEINRISEKYHLKVIYDAAHCFGVKSDGKSVCNHGDLSVLSFHATKVFNCIEGGAVICNNEQIKSELDALGNFGMNKNRQISSYGLNAKMNELQAAYGLANLKYVDEAIKKRKAATRLYRELLKTVNGITILNEQPNVDYNYCYFPIIINPAVFGTSVETVQAHLEDHGVYPKRYFYPLITSFDIFRNYQTNELPVAESISKNIICLPLSDIIQQDEIKYIVDLIAQLHERNG